ncbi:MAG: hypothetical protein GY937_13720 [bacterium]|nr:hypothetical protein [bacterium]
MGASVVHEAIAAAGVGEPNLNHELLATLLGSGLCETAITTNFDEHVEPLLSANVEVLVPSQLETEMAVDGPTYLKLHGSIGQPASLSFTLEQYDQLLPRNLALFELVESDAPLVVAGYSGYDTDVLPAIRAAAARAPWTAVVQHPGSNDDQPILDLADDPELRCSILVSDCATAFSVLCATLGLAFGEPSAHTATLRDDVDHYAAAVSKLRPFELPRVLMDTFGLAGEWNLVRRYARLCHDALTDERYRALGSAREFESLHHALALALRFAGDAIGARTMLGEARSSLEENGGPLSAHMRQQQAESIVADAPSQLHSGEPRVIEPRRGFLPSDVLTAQGRLAELFGGARDDHSSFMRNWEIGVTRRREGQPGAAIGAFEAGLEFALSERATHLERGRFLLDFGGAVAEHSGQLRDDEMAQQAHVILLASESATAEAGDYRTNGRANLMLARLYMGGESFDEARDRIERARSAAARTGDSALDGRIESLANLLGQLEAGRGPHRG